MRSAILFLILLAAPCFSQAQRDPNHIPFENIDVVETGRTYTKTFGSGITLDFSAVAGLTLGATTQNGNLTLGAGYDFTTLAGAGELNLNFTKSNASGNLFDIAPVFAGGATDTLTFSLFDVAAFAPTNAAGTDTVSYFTFGAFTDPGATITSEFLTLPSGLDNGINFNAMTALNLGSAGTDFTTTTNIIGTTAGIDVTVGNSTGILDLLSDDFSLATDDIDISDTGAITGATGIVSTGTASFATLTNSVAQTSTAGLGTGVNTPAAGASIAASEAGNGVHHRTTITLISYSGTVVGAANTVYSIKLYTFPAGWIRILGTSVNLVLSSETLTDTPELGLGSVASAADGALTGTEEDILIGAATGAISAIGGGGTAVQRAGAPGLASQVTAVLDGTATAAEVYLNAAEAAVWAGSGDILVTGTVVIEWVQLGDD